ncbi:D-3-phosphoglycerate dehydrogenase [Arcticibacter tournemirensis]|uniref:Phosphoglycerate dehydrogenase n=1 Tax=Arcticibacter tournemirensis TaxID=699437 RepID=A0A5M9HK74_9SPHI|nr:2-hydroxyacid dehydrogenase [Arcticibacter tournemirensis]KAA8486683.1 phosphoglycerate dehydrogenase [Arcticibacter tournemirensis]TQM49220.1 D-3-phosphoglycerate dehydrogenase [Arcticibacter tournemirensis]
MAKILIADKLHPAFKEKAQSLGYIVDDFPEYTREQTLAVIHDYDGLAIRTKFNIDSEIMEAAVNLKFIIRAGAGMDNIDEQTAKQKNIVCLNAPEGNRDAVAEHAIGMLLSLMNNLRKGDAEIRNGIWDREGNRGIELSGKTVGVIGYGFMGSSFAKKLRGFDVNIIAYDKYKSGFGDEFVKEVSMEQIVKHTDILSLHIPLTRETRQLVDDEYLFHFKKPIFLLNTARGEIVNTSAVLKAIKEGKILGAGLDVLESEKFPALGQQKWFDELIDNGKIILSPHVAGWTIESYRKISEVLGHKLEQLKPGKTIN